MLPAERRAHSLRDRGARQIPGGRANPLGTCPVRADFGASGRLDVLRSWGRVGPGRRVDARDGQPAEAGIV